jgi:hypothetical protein
MDGTNEAVEAEEAVPTESSSIELASDPCARCGDERAGLGTCPCRDEESAS